MNQKIKARAGSKFYNGIEIPEKCIIYVSQLNREFRIVCPNDCIIQFLDNSEYKTITKQQIKQIIK